MALTAPGTQGVDVVSFLLEEREQEPREIGQLKQVTP